jgi:hypothetical protein
MEVIEMNKTKNIVIEVATPEQLQVAMNEVNDAEDVFATQTHVTSTPDGVIYTAVFFCKKNEN